MRLDNDGIKEVAIPTNSSKGTDSMMKKHRHAALTWTAIVLLCSCSSLAAEEKVIGFRMTHEIKTGNSPVTAVAISDDGDCVLFGSASGKIGVFDIKKAKLRFIDSPSAGHCLAIKFVLKDTKAAVITTKAQYLFDRESLTAKQADTAVERVRVGSIFDSDREQRALVVDAEDESRIRSIDLKDGTSRELLSLANPVFHRKPRPTTIESFWLSPDYKTSLVSTNLSTFHVELNDKKDLTIKNEVPVSFKSLVMDQSKPQYAGVSGADIVLLDAKTGKRLGETTIKDTLYVSDLHFVPRSTTIAFVSHCGEINPGYIRVWDYSTNTHFPPVKCSEGPVMCLHINWACRKAAIGDGSGYIRIWDLVP